MTIIIPIANVYAKKGNKKLQDLKILLKIVPQRCMFLLPELIVVCLLLNVNILAEKFYIKGVGKMREYSVFGLKARTVMLKKNITMTSLAKELGITVSYLSDIFKGARNGATQKTKIAQFLGMPVDKKG